MDNPATLTVLSLCAGYSGIELGLSRALANPLRVVAVEIEAFALANLEAKAAQNALAIEALWPDLRTFGAERFRGCFDFVTAGYPCQPFSCAGKQQGEADPRHLWPDIARIVESVEPVWCFFENVPNHLNLGYPAVYGSLRDMGYKVEAGLFTAAECSAPHKRQRLFILAHCKASSIQGLRLQESGNRQPSQQYRGLCGVRETWPAGPGQPQHEWEEPRVVGNTADTGHSNRQQRETEEGSANERSQHARELSAGSQGSGDVDSQGQAQPRVGGAVDGTACRVDRLRLLGNGVVPAQAELAFRTLWEQMKG